MTVTRKSRAPQRAQPHVGRQKATSVAIAPSTPEQPKLRPAALPALEAQLRLIAAGGIFLLGLWSYWPILSELVDTWSVEPDYSHGFLVAPLAIYFLWARRASFPGLARGGMLLGLALLAVSCVLRYLSARFYFSFLDAWSILPWAAAIVATLGGMRLLWWSLPSILFLWFMVPLPFSAEGLLSHPLQRIATKISCFTLQLMGQPAFSEGNTIVLGSHHLEVAQACSGLRLFMGVVALAFAYVVLVRRAWWERAALLLAVVPIALVANSARIVGTGLLLQVLPDESHALAHDFAGWVMIPLAALMFWGVLWYLGRLFSEEEVMDMASVVREAELSRP
ncbi:MAG: exosortase/archaeosortase family protein [Pirellulaceae bacterium]